MCFQTEPSQNISHPALAHLVPAARFGFKVKITIVGIREQRVSINADGHPFAAAGVFQRARQLIVAQPARSSSKKLLAFVPV